MTNKVKYPLCARAQRLCVGLTRQLSVISTH